MLIAVPGKCRFSKRVLELRRAESGLSRLHRFDEAKNVRRMIDKIEGPERRAHAKALEEVRPPARPPAHQPPSSSCGAESEASLLVRMPLRHCSAAPPGVHRLRPEGPGHRRAHRQCQLEARLPLPGPWLTRCGVWWGLAERPPP